MNSAAITGQAHFLLLTLATIGKTQRFENHNYMIELII